MIRLLAVLAAVLVSSASPIGAPASARASGTAPGDPSAATAAADRPTVGDVIAPETQTCRKAASAQTPTTSADCLLWQGGSPVNFVIIAPSQKSLDRALAATVPRWRPAQGRWLVARGALQGECGTQWRPTTRQIELRIDPLNRRHIKLSDGSCPAESGGLVVAFGTAHTDRYDLLHCGGDFVVDLDQARDQLVASLTAGTPHVSVVYSTGAHVTHLPRTCETALSTDHRVAYVTLP